MNKYLDSIINFDINKAVKDYENYLLKENGETVMNNIIVNFSENIGNISKHAPPEMDDVELAKLLITYSTNMLKLWNTLKKSQSENFFEFNLDNPFKDELEKTDSYLANLLFK